MARKIPVLKTDGRILVRVSNHTANNPFIRGCLDDAHIPGWGPGITDVEHVEQFPPRLCGCGGTYHLNPAVGAYVCNRCRNVSTEGLA